MSALSSPGASPPRLLRYARKDSVGSPRLLRRQGSSQRHWLVVGSKKGGIEKRGGNRHPSFCFSQAGKLTPGVS